MAVLGKTLIGFVIMTVLVESAMAATHVVGGTSGWDTSTDLPTWVATQTFLVGDNLNFQYTSSHNVLEVSKADYDSCTGSNPLQSNSDGNTMIPLTSAGKRYFICGIVGHCSMGMKLEVDTSAATTSAPPPATASPPPTTTSPPPATASPPPTTASPPATTLPPSSLVSPASSKSPSATTLPPSPADSPLASSPTVSPSSVQSPEGAFSPLPNPDVIPSSESPSSITPTGSPSAASPLMYKTGLPLGFGIVMMLFLAL